MTTDFLTLMRTLHDATMAARHRTGDWTISTRATGGMVQVVCVTYAPGSLTATVSPVAPPQLMADAVRTLDALSAAVQ